MKIKDMHRISNLLSKTNKLLEDKEFLNKASDKVITQKQKIVVDCYSQLANVNLKRYLDLLDNFKNKSKDIEKCLWAIEYKRELKNKSMELYCIEWFHYIYKDVDLDEFIFNYDEWLEKENRFTKHLNKINNN